MATAAIASTTGTISASSGDQVIAVMPVVLVNGVQINPDGGRLLMQRADGSTYTGAASCQGSSTGQAVVNFVKIPA